jgi:hypothetical protein
VNSWESNQAEEADLPGVVAHLVDDPLKISAFLTTIWRVSKSSVQIAFDIP